MPGAARRAAVVTGAARGLGLSVAELLIEAGHRVTKVDIDRGLLGAASARDGEVLAIAADLEQTAACDRVMAESVAHWGGVDVLVNCAAVLHRVELDEIDE